MIEILENVKVFAQRRRRQGYDNTSIFSSITAELNVLTVFPVIYCHKLDTLIQNIPSQLLISCFKLVKKESALAEQ